mmetsp:Transcript_21652/g.34757  ORF Transcript_21652/g.34757 Transcript_21652/m.34757 type:complete len:202 (+) Transcript_21652:1230-1835(+)
MHFAPRFIVLHAHINLLIHSGHFGITFRQVAAIFMLVLRQFQYLLQAELIARHALNGQDQIRFEREASIFLFLREQIFGKLTVLFAAQFTNDLRGRFMIVDIVLIHFEVGNEVDHGLTDASAILLHRLEEFLVEFQHGRQDNREQNGVEFRFEELVVAQRFDVEFGEHEKLLDVGCFGRDQLVDGTHTIALTFRCFFLFRR